MMSVASQAEARGDLVPRALDKYEYQIGVDKYEYQIGVQGAGLT